MIPADLKGRLEELAYFHGGAERAKSLLPEETLIKMALFNGPVGTISPFMKRIGQEVVPIHSLNMSAIGYAGGTYSVLNARKRFLYSDVCQKTENGDWIFGLTKKDRQLIERGHHGEIFYISFSSSSGPQLAIVWLSKELPSWLIDKTLVQWEDLQEKSRPKTRFDEMYLETSGIGGEIYIGFAAGPSSSGFSAEDIKRAAKESGAVSGVFAGESNYIRLKSAHWMAIWASIDGIEYTVELSGISGRGSERILRRDNVYYIRPVNSGGGWLFSSGVPGSYPVVSTPFEEKHITAYATASLVGYDLLTTENMLVLTKEAGGFIAYD